MDFNFIKLARSFVKKNDISEKEKANEFIRKLEEKFRELFKIKRDSKILNNMNITLFSIYDNLDIMKFNDSYSSNNLTLYSNSNKLQTISPNFKYNFDIFSEHQLIGLNWDNLFVRGDSVLLSLLTSTNTIVDRYYYQKQYHNINFDIELCIYDLDTNQIKEKIIDIQNKIKIYNPYEIKYINTDSVIIMKSQFPFRDIKINLKSYKSPTEIILDSYADCCAIGYDGTFVWCSPRAHYAITSSKNIYNAIKILDNDYNIDIVKYFKLGFSIEFPSNDFDIFRILNINTLLKNKLGTLLVNNDNIDPLINCIIMNDFDQFKNKYNETYNICYIMHICILFNRMMFIEYLLKLSTFYDINVLYDLIKFGDVDIIILFLKNYKISNIDKLIIISINRYLNSYNSDKEISRSIIIYLLSINKNQPVTQNSELYKIITNSNDDWLIEYCSKIINLNNNIHKYTFQQHQMINQMTNQINNETQQILIESIKTKNIDKITEILSSDPLLIKYIIHYACKYDDVDIFKLAIKYMKIYNLESEELEYIYNNNSINCYKWLIEEPEINTIKNIVIKSNEYLIKYGLLDFLDINFKNSLIDTIMDNNYYIKLAATIGNPKSIMYLSKYQNQSIDHIDENGDTLLHLLMNSTFDSIDQIHSFHIILKSSKIENIINSKNKYGQTPLHKYLMIDRYNYSLIDIMINNGVKLDIYDETGYYPIHTAIMNKNLKALEVLYRYDKNIIDMRTDKTLYTPLMLSIIHNNTDIAKMLIELNCDQNAKDIYGNTALHYTCIYSNCIIFELLKDKQLLENCFKYTYVDYAINRAKLLVSNDDLIVDRINILKCLDLVKKYINHDKSQMDINIIKKMYEFIFMYI